VIQKKIRVLIAKAGRDGHTRGSTVVAHALREAEMEVILSGLYRTAPEIVEMALKNDVNVIGLSSLDGTHGGPLKGILKLLKEKRRQDILVIAGGVIHEEDIPELKELGVVEIFGPGTPVQKIITFIHDHTLKYPF
jgi:methylmalonyl-CoA mutase C-terminal domain/subunit